MRILLAHNSLYFPSHGGGDKSNRILMEALAGCGHEIEVLARLENFSAADEQRFLAELEARETPADHAAGGVVEFRRNGVRVFTLTGSPRLRQVFAERIEAFNPDVILCSTDDPGALLLEVALRYPKPRIVYLVRATVAVPFGPDAAFPNTSKTAMIGRVDSIIGVSEYVANYVRRWSGFNAIHVPISLLESNDWAPLGDFENAYVLMVNPCAVKGISIFLALAEALPEVRFAAVPTWGTNAGDLALLRQHANIRLFEPVDDIASLLRQTKIVLVPSVWAEARSRMVVEAMIHGIPVIASDVGGLHEAKLGVPYLLPVNPIQTYQAHVDANMVPIAHVPPQNIQPWVAALRSLIANREHYREISLQSRVAALHYAETLTCRPLAAHLDHLILQPKRPSTALSGAKKKLLALRLAKTRDAHTGDWFTASSNQNPATLYVFPHAGAGTVEYRWVALPDHDIVIVRLPGRETRIGETPFTAMDELIPALLEAFRSRALGRFSFFGHSMGAGVAFELTRALRGEGLPLPERLIVSSARAPQLRTAKPNTPEPSDDDLLNQIRNLGTPNGDALHSISPALRADLHLYRNYLYHPQPPLPVFIEVHGGVDDPSLGQEHLAAWQEQSAVGSSLTMHPGGHFYWRGLESNDVFGSRGVRRVRRH